MMADVEPSTTVAETQSIINAETTIKQMEGKLMENNDQSTTPGNTDITKAEISAISLAVDPSKNISEQNNIPMDLQMTDGLPKKNGNPRRIIAEDPEWNLAAVESLSSLALKSIVKNFQDKPILAGLPSKYKDKVVSLLSTDISLPIASTVINSDPYWKKRAQEKFKLCNVSEHNNSWKQLFFEMYIQQVLESFVPKTSGEYDIFEKVILDLKTSADYVEKLNIRQLRPTEPPELNPAATRQLMEGREPPKELIVKATDPLPDHFDVTLLFKNLYKLKELSLFYGVQDCGINFNWAYFGMTINDCVRLADSLQKNFVLTSLSVRSSGIDDDKCRILAEAISKNTVLKHLNLSYNNIGDIGAQALSKVLSIPETALESINLGNNKIQKDGAIAIGKALSLNHTVKHLDLRLNSVGDDGCTAICLQACKNTLLESLNLSGNCIGPKSASSICVLLRRNLKQFQSLDLSSNQLANLSDDSNEYRKGNNDQFDNYSIPAQIDSIGKSIFEAVNRNKYITRLDLRMTSLSEECIIGIQGILKENSFN